MATVTQSRADHRLALPVPFPVALSGARQRGAGQASRLCALLFAAAAAFALPGGASAESCTDPDLAPLRPCTDQRAAAVTPRPAWVACGGACIIRQDAGNAVLLDLEGRALSTFEGLSFLPGNGMTQCLTVLPFLSAYSELFLFDMSQGTIAEPLQLPLAPLYDPAPHEDPPLLAAMLSSAQLSCDGKRFFSPLQDGMGFTVEDIAPDGGPAAQNGSGTVITISPSGRYALEIGGSGNFVLRDFVSDKSYPTAARPELDVPFFDVTERYLLVRIAPGQAAIPEPDTRTAAETLSAMHVTITDLATGKQVGTPPYPVEGGLDFRVEPAAQDQSGPMVLLPVRFGDADDGDGDGDGDTEPAGSE